MELCEINSEEDFSTIYTEHNLVSIKDKISFLKGAMKIRSERSDIEDTPEEELIGLQELALSHLWEGLQ